MNIPFKTIWERYFLWEITKVFVLFLVAFYGIYVIIDYSTHSRSFHNYHFNFLDIVSFYGYEFITRMDVLIPFAILIACIKTLCSLNTHNELVALMVSGITLKRLLFPFVAFGLFFTGIIYFNTEVLQPRALKYHKQLDHRRAKEKRKKNHHPYIQQLTLDDQSSLIFESYDEVAERFHDAFWVKSIDDIYRIEYLDSKPSIPVGSKVEHLKRDPKGNLEIVEFADEKLFPEIHVEKAKLLDSVASPRDYALSTIKSKLADAEHPLSEKEASLLSTYYYKLAIPWLCLLAIIAPAPFCTRFTRALPVFMIYAISLFGLVAFYLIMDAALLLGERQVVAPAVAIWIPFSCFFALFGWRYARL